MTLQEIFKNAGRKVDFDNRSYYVRSVNNVLKSGLVTLQVAPFGEVFINKKGDSYDFKVKAGRWFLACLTNSKDIEPELILRHIGVLLQKEEVKAIISSQVMLHDNTCSKCKGKGIIPVFMHVCEGVCFDCLGLGVNVHTPKDVVKIN